MKYRIDLENRENKLSSPGAFYQKQNSGTLSELAHVQEHVFSYSLYAFRSCVTACQSYCSTILHRIDGNGFISPFGSDMQER